MINELRVDEQLITAGQPTEEELRDLAGEGVGLVINLAVYEPGRSLPDEEGIVRSLGMEYLHIPVVWNDPRPEDFDRFLEAMESVGERRCLIHCAANYRVTGFYGLYGLARKGWSEAEFDGFVGRVWNPDDYPVWKEFLSVMKARIEAATR